MPAERDPRVDPRPGDVVREWNGNARLEVTSISVRRYVHYTITNPLARNPIESAPMLYTMSLARWKQQMKDVEVLHVAEVS